MSAPVIGLTTYREHASWGVWQQRADLLPTEYAAAVEATGGVPMLLPPLAQLGAAAVVASRLDALMITGGADVDPGRYAAQQHPRTANWRPDRDGWEASLLDAAEAIELPVLGVCRGMQLMAVHAGGSLDQHTPDVVAHEQHSPGGDVFGTIEVATIPGTRVSSLVGGRLSVSCHHHQSVREHPGYLVSARAWDGTIEAMELSNSSGTADRFCIAVQWHPETAADAGLLAGLVRAGAAYAAARS